MTAEDVKVENIETMGLDAGRLCLDFANTANWHASEQPVEYLTGYSALVTFGRRTGTLSDEAASGLLKRAYEQPDEAAAVLETAIELREALYRIFDEVSHGHAPEADDLALLNRHLSQALARSQVVAEGNGFTWTWSGDEAALDRMLWPVARSAADLLTSAEIERVGQCADDRGCGWLFFDTTRNHSRRWCDMKDCGNRAKARRHYRRHKAAQAAA
jgi:predicted RNA-binding Zn ribbon-like protein